MSSISTKAGSSRRSERTSDYPTAWSEWSWNEQYNCDVRYRLKAGSRYSLKTERLGLTTPQMITSTNMDRYNRLSQTLSRAAEDMRIPNHTRHTEILKRHIPHQLQQHTHLLLIPRTKCKAMILVTEYKMTILYRGMNRKGLSRDPRSPLSRTVIQKAGSVTSSRQTKVSFL